MCFWIASDRLFPLFPLVTVSLFCVRAGNSTLCLALKQGHPSPNSHWRNPSPPLPSLFNEVWVITPGKIFGIKDAREFYVMLDIKNQRLYEPGFLTVSCNFRISSKRACRIVKRYSCTPEISPFRWVLAACHAISSLIVADWQLHYIIQRPPPPHEILLTQRF